MCFLLMGFLKVEQLQLPFKQERIQDMKMKRVHVTTIPEHLSKNKVQTTPGQAVGTHLHRPHLPGYRCGGSTFPKQSLRREIRKWFLLLMTPVFTERGTLHISCYIKFKALKHEYGLLPQCRDNPERTQNIHKRDTIQEKEENPYGLV